MIYGHSNTIHRTGSVDVELDKSGKVVSVWYRCMPLPFTQTVVGDARAAEMVHCYESQPPMQIDAIDFREV